MLHVNSRAPGLHKCTTLLFHHPAYLSTSHKGKSHDIMKKTWSSYLQSYICVLFQSHLWRIIFVANFNIWVWTPPPRYRFDGLIYPFFQGSCSGIVIRNPWGSHPWQSRRRGRAHPVGHGKYGKNTERHTAWHRLGVEPEADPWCTYNQHAGNIDLSLIMTKETLELEVEAKTWKCTWIDLRKDKDMYVMLWHS